MPRRPLRQLPLSPEAKPLRNPPAPNSPSLPPPGCSLHPPREAQTAPPPAARSLTKAPARPTDQCIFPFFSYSCSSFCRPPALLSSCKSSGMPCRPARILSKAFVKGVLSLPYIYGDDKAACAPLPFTRLKKGKGNIPPNLYETLRGIDAIFLEKNGILSYNGKRVK